MLLVWRKSAHLLDKCSRGNLLSFSHTNTVISRPAAAPLRCLSCPGWGAGCCFLLTPGADSQEWKWEIEMWNIPCAPLLDQLSPGRSRSCRWVWVEHLGKSPVLSRAPQCWVPTEWPGTLLCSTELRELRSSGEFSFCSMGNTDSCVLSEINHCSKNSLLGGDFALFNFCRSSFKCNSREVSASLFAVCWQFLFLKTPEQHILQFLLFFATDNVWSHVCHATFCVLIYLTR